MAPSPGHVAGAEFGFDLGGGFETDGVEAEGAGACDEFGDVVGEEAFLGAAAGAADGFGFVRQDEMVEVGITPRLENEWDGGGGFRSKAT